jgi:20S proteasome alpha/beta subunit
MTAMYMPGATAVGITYDEGVVLQASAELLMEILSLAKLPKRHL